MVFASGFSWFLAIPGIGNSELLKAQGMTPELWGAFCSAWLACGVALTFAVVARMGLESAKKRTGLEKYFAAEKLSPLGLAEALATFVMGFMGDAMDKADIPKFFPLIGALFTYIFLCNIQAIIPGFLPPTDNVNTNFGMAIVVFLTFNAVGLIRDPVGYISHLMGPVLPLAILLFPIEVIGLFVRPVSLTIRLTGNMFGDHAVYTTFADMIPVFVPVPLLVLAILVSSIQSFVFAMLTSIYIGLSVPHHEHDEHAHH
jgi:F-type H+-transporting ATPase subunit a